MTTGPIDPGAQKSEKPHHRSGPEGADPGSEVPPRARVGADGRRALSSLRPAWHRQDQESAAAFGAATVYFDLGPKRSLRQVAEDCRKSFSLIGRWSSQWDWVGRARSYDDHLAKTWQEQKERALLQHSRQWIDRWEGLREREWQAAESLLNLAEKVLAQDLRYRGNYTARDAAVLLEMASDLARRAAAMPTRLAPEPRLTATVNPVSKESVQANPQVPSHRNPGPANDPHWQRD